MPELPGGANLGIGGETGNVREAASERFVQFLVGNRGYRDRRFFQGFFAFASGDDDLLETTARWGRGRLRDTLGERATAADCQQEEKRRTSWRVPRLCPSGRAHTTRKPALRHFDLIPIKAQRWLGVCT